MNSAAHVMQRSRAATLREHYVTEWWSVEAKDEFCLIVLVISPSRRQLSLTHVETQRCCR